MVIRERQNVQDVHAIREPAIRGGFQIFNGGILNAFQRNLVGGWVAEEHLIAGELVGLSTEAADAFDAADEVGHVIGLNSLQFFGGGPVFQKARQLFIHLLFYWIETLSRARGLLNVELSADLS